MVGLGLFLIRVVCWASEHISRTPRRPRDFALVGAAHAAMAGVTVIGFVVDHLPIDTAADRPGTNTQVATGRRPVHPSVAKIRSGTSETQELSHAARW